jgi:serine phosphatase RsbU (regulator of sigma subunit)/predicted enzyme related to lactoylglutathione lyase
MSVFAVAECRASRFLGQVAGVNPVCSCAIITGMSNPPSAYRAHRCGFHPDRRDPYLRLSTVTVFVRDEDESLRFYLDQLGFSLAWDTRFPSGERWVAVTPPDGTGMLALTAPKPGSEEYKLIGRPTQVVFLTEDVHAKFEEWRQRGVHFQDEPQIQPSGAISTVFEDTDGNSFTLLRFDEMTREVDLQRRAHAERLDSARRHARELEIARQAQARLFPQTLPRAKTLDYAGACLQAREVGGDYYDFLNLGRDFLGLVIGDVSGKGTAAALLMANLQAHLRNQCATYWSRPFTPFVLEQPGRFLRTINRLFYDNTADNAYATLFFAEYDDSTQRLRYANCGHLSALLLRNHRDVERLDATCGVLGLFKDWECEVQERPLLSGDTLCLYTDGVTEWFNDAGEEFGEHRLIEALHEKRELPSQELLASVVDQVRQFSPQHQHDDATVVVARCTRN